MPDKSILGMKGMQEKAFLMKIEAEGITEEQAKRVFIERVKNHWKKKTIPSKFGSDIPWKEADSIIDGMNQGPRCMAELADYVMYPHIRSAMMGLMMSKSGGRVLALNEDGSLTEYSDKVKKNVKLDDVGGE